MRSRPCASPVVRALASLALALLLLGCEQPVPREALAERLARTD